MPEYTLPTIPHATVNWIYNNRVELTMNEGWVYWDKYDYYDENGVYVEPLPEEVIYLRYGVFAPDWNFDEIMVVAEDDAPANQIYGAGTVTE